MTTHTYLGWVWIAGAAALTVWALASAITYLSSRPDRTRIRLLTTLVLASTALVIADIARFRWRVTVLGIPPNADAPGVAIYRTCWVGLLLVCTEQLYWQRFRAWLRRGAKR